MEKACALFDPAAEEIVLVLQSRERPVLRKINLELGRLLPKYMLPRRLAVLEALPETPNRKIDRAALKGMLIQP